MDCRDKRGKYSGTAKWWSKLGSPVFLEILWSVCFSGLNTGWIVGDYGIILKSTNGLEVRYR